MGELNGSRPLSLMDQLAQSAKFKQLRENVAPVDDEEEEVRDVLVLMFFFFGGNNKRTKT